MMNRGFHGYFGGTPIAGWGLGDIPNGIYRIYGGSMMANDDFYDG